MALISYRIIGNLSLDLERSYGIAARMIRWTKGWLSLLAVQVRG